MADLHCHTSASFDSLSRPAAVMRAATERGLTHLAITDHDRIDIALAARDAAPHGLAVIVGQEVRTSAGDLIALFIERPIPPGLTPSEAAARVRDQGGAVGLAHPFDRFRAGAGRRGWEDELERLIPLLDYVETWNARLMLGDGNRRAAEFALANGLPGVAVSDAHTLMEVGVAYTIFAGPLGSAEELRAALAEARLVTAHGSRFVRLGMPLAKLVQRLRGNRRVQPA
ncbi:MAG TPA: PHP domain-containing protein [Candidatus Limnocylindrales bacterium]|nr:PHP domain-containing protein [Candidatus Limnocylindrales bacterium]